MHLSKMYILPLGTSLAGFVSRQIGESATEYLQPDFKPDSVWLIPAVLKDASQLPDTIEH